MIVVGGVRQALADSPGAALEAAARLAGLAPGEVASAHLHRVSVDARRQKPVLVYAVALRLKDPAREAACLAACPAARRLEAGLPAIRPGSAPLPGPVVVCGLGPAGLFAALALARAGYRPTVLERGPGIEARRAAVEAFEQGGALCENANVQFGEGGAGTFSDGKLTTRIGDALCGEVTRSLLEAGAPEEIAWQARPHIGTDKLGGVFAALRRQAQQAGAAVCFDTRLTGLRAAAGRLAAVHTAGGDMPCGVLVLAAGHSARDTFAMLAGAGVPMEPKPFSVGFRIEHLQRDIDEGLYHGAAGHPALPPGEYQLAARAGGRGVYTFCMCPGGSVVAAASEAGGVVTNGMSLYARGGPNANAAVVAGVSPADFGAGSLDGVAFQRGLERAAFAAGGGGYAAPAETLGSFMQGLGRLEIGRVEPTYPRGVRAANLSLLLPGNIVECLRAGLVRFGKKLPGYAAPHAVLTGLETRTSSPVRITRGEGLESAGLAGLYPCGEGAGYAGGIMSAAADGLRVARAIIERYAPP